MKLCDITHQLWTLVGPVWLVQYGLFVLCKKGIHRIILQFSVATSRNILPGLFRPSCSLAALRARQMHIAVRRKLQTPVKPFHDLSVNIVALCEPPPPAICIQYLYGKIAVLRE